jgi:hypothetical protein
VIDDLPEMIGWVKEKGGEGYLILISFGICASTK